MTIKIYVSNLWSDASFEKLWIINFFKNQFGLNVVKATSPNDCDIIICSVFGNISARNTIREILEKKKKKTFLISLENFDRFPWIKPLIQKFDLATGLNYVESPNYHRIPYYVWSEYHDYYNKTYTINNKLKNICMVSNNAQKLRLSILAAFKTKDISVDCFGKICNNILEDKSYNKKLDILSNYYFNICPENSYADGYSTEKIHHALYCNCIPIYWGDIDRDRDFYNLDKVLLINKDLSNFSDIIENCKNLIDNRKSLLELMSLSPFSVDKDKIIQSEIFKLKTLIQNKLL